jgi:hypothetical protein
MSSESALSFSSLLLSYLLKSGAAYLCLWLLSRCIPNSQIRFWLYALLLGGVVASWLWLFVSPYVPSLPDTEVPIAHIALAKPFSWSLAVAIGAAVAKGFSRARSAYEIILAFLLLRFCGHFWQVRNLLRASQKSPDWTSALLELVRSGSGAPPCELRLVNDLRSPATTGWWQPKVCSLASLCPG